MIIDDPVTADGIQVSCRAPSRSGYEPIGWMSARVHMPRSLKQRSGDVGLPGHCLPAAQSARIPAVGRADSFARGRDREPWSRERG
jgi:hypothetical protein